MTRFSPLRSPIPWALFAAGSRAEARPWVGWRLLGQACLGACLLAAALTSAHAQYKWRDAQGRMHVSDMPPPADVPERNVLQRPAARAPQAPAVAAPAASANLPGNKAAPAGKAASAAAAAQAAAPADPELMRRRQQADQQAQQQAQSEARLQAARRAENCDRSQRFLALLKSGQRMVRMNPSGEVVPLDEATRRDDIQRHEAVVRSDCR